MHSSTLILPPSNPIPLIAEQARADIRDYQHLYNQYNRPILTPEQVDTVTSMPGYRHFQQSIVSFHNDLSVGEEIVFQTFIADAADDQGLPPIIIPPTREDIFALDFLWDL